jgi:hypothetical protein
MQISRSASLCSFAAEWFSVAVISTATEKEKSLCVLCVSSEAGGELESVDSPLNSAVCIGPHTNQLV